MTIEALSALRTGRADRWLDGGGGSAKPVNDRARMQAPVPNAPRGRPLPDQFLYCSCTCLRTVDPDHAAGAAWGIGVVFHGWYATFGHPITDADARRESDGGRRRRRA